MHQQLWGYKVEEKLYLGVHEQKRLNTTDLGDSTQATCVHNCVLVGPHARKCSLVMILDLRLFLSRFSFLLSM
jgi:hypothetical protein